MIVPAAPDHDHPLHHPDVACQRAHRDVAEVRLPKADRDADHSRTAPPAPEIGELLSTWIGVRMQEIDDLVDEARRRAEAIPDRSSIAVLLGELLLRVTVLEQELAELKGGKR